jgi:hypothetical protein
MENIDQLRSRIHGLKKEKALLRKQLIAVKFRNELNAFAKCFYRDRLREIESKSQLMPKTKIENIGDSDFTYHDIELEFGSVKQKIFDLPHNLKLTCTRVGGWELWQQDRVIAGEYNDIALKIYVAGILICGESKSDKPA